MVSLFFLTCALAPLFSRYLVEGFLVYETTYTEIPLGSTPTQQGIDIWFANAPLDCTPETYEYNSWEVSEDLSFGAHIWPVLVGGGGFTPEHPLDQLAWIEFNDTLDEENRIYPVTNCQLGRTTFTGAGENNWEILTDDGVLHGTCFGARDQEYECGAIGYYYGWKLLDCQYFECDFLTLAELQDAYE